MYLLNSKFKVLLSNTLVFALGSIGSKFIMFFLLPLYTNTLTPEQYGVTELVITGSYLLIPFLSLSIQDAVLRFGLDKNNNSGEVLKNACLVLLGGTIVSVCLSPLVKLYAPIADWTLYFIIIMLLHMYRTILSLYIKAVGKTKLFAIDVVLYTLILAILNIVFLLVYKMEIVGYFISMICAALVSILFLTIMGGIVKDLINSKINKILLKQMLIFSLPMILNAVSWWINNSSDRIMLEYFKSTKAVGIYSIAAKMPSLLTSITIVFTQAWVISAVNEYDTTKDETFYKKTFSGYNLLLVVFASLIILIIKPFMQIYVGSSFTCAWKYVPYLLLGAIFLSYSSFFGAIYTSAKKSINVMLSTLLAAFVNIILNLLLIPKIGIQGAAIATMTSYLILGIYRMLDSRRYFKFYIDFKNVFLSLIVLVVQCTVVSLDFYPMFTSLLCFTLIILINFKSVCNFAFKSKKFVEKIFLKRKEER